MRNLTLNEIERLSGRKNVRKIAVENFLCSMGNDEHVAFSNLELDASMYRWNSATVKAISDGIKAASKRKEVK